MTPSRVPTARRRRSVYIALIAIALISFPPIVAAAGASSGTTPLGAVGDALRTWIDKHASAGVELEQVYFGEHDIGVAAQRAGGLMTRRDFGVFAAAGGLDKGEAYVSIPWTLVLSAEGVSSIRPELNTLLTSLKSEFGQDDKSALLLALIYERFVSVDDSPWADYFQSLADPNDNDSYFDTPLYWSPNLLKELQGSEVFDDAITDQAKVRAVHNGFSRRAFTQKPFADAFNGLDKNTTLKYTQWAWSITHSRASNVPTKGLALIPLADMINDRREGHLRSDGYDGGSNNSGNSNSNRNSDFAVYDPQYDRAVVFAKREYAAGEEVFESYGGWSDADTLLSAGYVLGEGSESSHDSSSCAVMRLSPHPFSNEVELTNVESALRDHGFEVPWRVCLAASSRVTHNAKRIAKWVSIVAENTGESDADGDVEGGVRGGKILAQILTQRLENYPTTVDEDADALHMYREELEQIVGSLGEVDRVEDGSAEDDEKIVSLESRARTVRRASLATTLRSREKKTFMTILKSLSEEAGGDAFVWADSVKASEEKDEL